MVRRKYWGRFWCSWTNRKWPTLIPDCDNSAANCVTLWVGFWAWPHAILKKTSNCRYVTRRPWWYPRIIWGASLDGASYVLSIPLQISEKPMRSFTSVQMIHTHIYIVVKTIINHPQNHNFNGWYFPINNINNINNGVLFMTLFYPHLSQIYYDLLWSMIYIYTYTYIPISLSLYIFFFRKMQYTEDIPSFSWSHRRWPSCTSWVPEVPAALRACRACERCWRARWARRLGPSWCRSSTRPEKTMGKGRKTWENHGRTRFWRVLMG